MIGKKALQIPFHPFLIGFFPALSFLAHNIKEVEPGETVRVFVAILIGVNVLFLLLRILMRDKFRAAIMASIIAILFFSYGHIYGLVKHASVMDISIGRHRYLVVVYIALLILGLWRTMKGRDYSAYTIGLNAFGVILLIFPLVQIISFEWGAQRFYSPQEISEEQQFEMTDPSSVPDVYYIILDAYTRDDTLLAFYEYDNSPFLEALEERGFFIARCSQSNYSWTHLSLGSTLNMNYIQDIYPREDGAGLANLVRESIVRKYFEQFGYTIVSFDTAYIPTQWYDAPIYYSYSRDFAKESIFFGGMSKYETLFF